MENIKGYNENKVLRGSAIAACIICAFILGHNHTSIFHSYYDHFMVREIFRDYEHWTIGLNDNVGLFWKYLNFFVVSSYIVVPLILFFNIADARKRTRTAAITDLVAYGYLALSVPADFFVCMIGSRSYDIDFLSFTFVFEVLAFVFFAGAFVICVLSCIKSRGGSASAKGAALKTVILILLLALPCMNLIKAVKLASDYAPNYGLFKVNSTEYDPIVDDMLFNYDNGGIEYDGALYICSNLGKDEGYSIDKLDLQGDLVHVTDIDAPGSSLKYDVYNGKIYYVSEILEDLLRYYEIMSKDIETGEIEVLYRGSSVDKGSVDMFKVKDGLLYYHVGVDRDHSIYYFDLDNAPSERQLFVSDVINMFDRNEVTCAFLYNYWKEPSGYYAPIVYVDDVKYIVTVGVTDNADEGFPIMTTLEASSQKLFSSSHIEGFTYADGSYYFYNEATGDITRYDIASGDIQVIANVEENDPRLHHTLYIYGDHLLLKSREKSVVIDI